MKQVIQILVNILLLSQYILLSIAMLLWHGKLIKVSPYHVYNPKKRGPEGKEYMDEYFQRDIYPVSVKKKKEVANEILLRR